MADDQPPQGKRFSLVYLQRAELFADSRRMRTRLAHLLDELSIDRDKLATAISREQGVRVPYTGFYDIKKFLQEAELRDVLDFVTTVAHHGVSHRYARRVVIDNVVKFSRRVFAEEGVRYRIDDDAGVHLAVDEEFERSRVLAVACLGGSRYANAALNFEAAYRALDNLPNPDGKAAIRSIFGANEGLFRLMFPAAGMLKSDDVRGHLVPVLNVVHRDDQAARVAGLKMADSFGDWIAAAHQYRHEPGTEEPAQPPIALAILMVSQGAAFLRWLIETDKAMSAGKVT